MHWGYALGWPKQFMTLDEEPLLARQRFVHQWGLESTSPGFDALAALEPAALDHLLEFVTANGMRINPVFHAELFVRDEEGARTGDPDAIARATDVALEFLARHGQALRALIVSTCAGPVHRFMKRPSLCEQLDFMRTSLQPLADGLAGHGIPLGIENHGDYYVSDVVGLGKQMRNTGLFLDTGNTYLIGEQPLLAFELGAPYVVGTHFKDQHVRPRPDGRPLNFEVGNAVPGTGDVPLRDAYRLIKAHARDPERVAMEIEMFPPAGVEPLDAMQQAVDLIHELEAMK